MHRSEAGSGAPLLSADRALTEAAHLEYVCQPRPLHTGEIFGPNAFYGNDRILKRYAGLPEDYALKVVVPHGITFRGDYLWDEERRARLPAILSYGKRRVAALRETGKTVLLGAVPFAYVPRLLEERYASFERKGTLFFPSHSTERIYANGDFTGLAERVAALPEELQPVTVCIYWQDYLLGQHRAFAERKLRIVSAGHINDPEFLLRLYFLLRSHRFAAGNSWGSHTFYALLAGCGYFHLPGFPMRRQRLDEKVADVAALDGQDLRHLHEAFDVPTFPPLEGQRKLAEDYAGLSHLHSPAQLKRTLLFAEQLDAFGIAWRGGLHFAPPKRYERLARALLKRSWQLIARGT